MRVVLGTVAAMAILALAGCGDGGDDDGGESSGGAAGYGSAPATTATEPEAAAAEPKPGTEITVADSDYGRILFDGSDQAIYLFEKEAGAKSECYGECAEAWPPVLTEGEPVAGGARPQDLLGAPPRGGRNTQGA